MQKQVVIEWILMVQNYVVGMCKGGKNRIHKASNFNTIFGPQKKDRKIFVRNTYCYPEKRPFVTLLYQDILFDTLFCGLPDVMSRVLNEWAVRNPIGTSRSGRMIARSCTPMYHTFE